MTEPLDFSALPHLVIPGMAGTQYPAHSFLASCSGYWIADNACGISVMTDKDAKAFVSSHSE